MYCQGSPDNTNFPPLKKTYFWEIDCSSLRVDHYVKKGKLVNLPDPNRLVWMLEIIPFFAGRSAYSPIKTMK